MFKHVIIIAGVPRSGTSWLGQIIDSAPNVAYRFQPIFSYAFKDAVNMDSHGKDYERFYEGIYKSTDDFLLQTDKRKKGLYPTFEKKDNPECLAFKTCRYQYLLSKMLQYSGNLKIFGIVRNPCGVINSWLKNPKEFPSEANPREEWRFGSCRNQGRPEEFFGFYKWKEVAHLYFDLQEKYPNRVRIVKYEDLLDSPVEVSQSIFSFVNLEFTEQTNSFLEACHSVHKEGPYAVFKDKSVSEQWKSELDPYIVSEIKREIEGTRLEGFLT